jgi:hypothetical protein
LFDTAPSRINGQRCKTCAIVDSFSGDDRVALVEAIGNPEMSSQVIVNVLKQAGVIVSVSALSRHRRDCR